MLIPPLLLRSKKTKKSSVKNGTRQHFCSFASSHNPLSMFIVSTATVVLLVHQAALCQAHITSYPSSCVTNESLLANRTHIREIFRIYGGHDGNPYLSAGDFGRLLLHLGLRLDSSNNSGELREWHRDEDVYGQYSASSSRNGLSSGLSGEDDPQEEKGIKDRGVSGGRRNQRFGGTNLRKTTGIPSTTTSAPASRKLKKSAALMATEATLSHGEHHDHAHGKLTLWFRS